MTYGILATGVTTASLRHLCVCHAKHMRAISKAPVHLHFEPTDALLARLRVQPLPDFLQKIANRRQLAAEPVFASALRRALLFLQRSPASDTLHRATQVDPVACPTCGLYFSCQATMRLHHARKHGSSLQKVAASEPAKITEIQLADHYLDGVPTCRHCGAVYSRRQAFRNHILNTCPVLHKGQDPLSVPSKSEGMVPTVAGRCAAGSETPMPNTSVNAQAALPIPNLPDQNTPPSVGLGFLDTSRPLPDVFSTDRPLFRQPYFVQQRKRGWKGLLRQQEVCLHLRHHCIFCNQRCVANAGGMKQHIRRSHPDAWKHHQAAEDACTSVTLGPQPCS